MKHSPRNPIPTQPIFIRTVHERDATSYYFDAVRLKFRCEKAKLVAEKLKAKKRPE